MKFVSDFQLWVPDCIIYYLCLGLQLLKCINHLSTDPHCLENLQRADAIKHLIPNLDLKDGPLVSQIHHEVSETIKWLLKCDYHILEAHLKTYGLICTHQHAVLTKWVFQCVFWK